MMDNIICPYCKGTKHIFVKSANTQKLVRCRCLIKDDLRRKLESLNLDFNNIDYLVDESGFRFSEDRDGAAARKLYSVYEQGRAAKKMVILNCAISVIRVKSILSMLVAKVNRQDVLYRDLADFINDSFNNEPIELNKLNIITTLYSTSKQLKSKFIQDLYIQAQLQNKLMILVVQDFQELKQETPDLAIQFSKQNSLVIPEV